ALVSSHPVAATVPATVSVAAGAASATFAIATDVMAGSTVVTISGTLGATTRSAALSVTGLPDLQVTSVSAPTKAARGRTISVSATVRNAGAAAAPASTLQFYLSLDGSADSGDRLLAGRQVPALAKNASVTLSTTMTIPRDLPPGTYRIIAVADAAGSVPEQSESNNAKASGPIAVTHQSASTMSDANVASSRQLAPARGAVRADTGALVALTSATPLSSVEAACRRPVDYSLVACRFFEVPVSLPSPRISRWRRSRSPNALLRVA